MSSTQAKQALDMCIHHLFEAHVDKNPEATALVFDNQALTYQELNDRTNQIAHHLQSLGVTNETLVGIYIERSLEMVMAILAIYKSNGAYVPLDPNYPDERLDYMIEDSGVTVVLTQEKLVDSLPKTTDVQAVALDTFDFQSYSTDNPTGGHAQQLAYMIYTSGSTGKPKGVLLEHRSIVNYITSVAKLLDYQASDRSLLFSSINFDSSVEEYLLPLTNGATLYVRTEDMVSSIPTFTRYLEAWGITGMSLPTAFWHILVNKMEGLPPSMRYTVIGGEKAFPARLARWQELTDVKLWNAYGPTEATIAVTLGEVSGADATQEVPLGDPVDGVSLYLLDEHLQPVPHGNQGELYFGGVQIARGYHKRPDLTAERFIDHPTIAGERIYKTGDLARYREDGVLEFLGRSDDQVKIRGFRIELGSIESALQNVSSGATVLAKQDENDDSRLVAYFVSEKSVEEVHDYLKEKLPAHMVPSAYIALDELPITAGGKVDKHALPAPDWSLHSIRREYVAPRNATEEKLADIWSEMLKIPQISITDNFFDLGGHSLIAIRIFAQIEKEMGKSLPLATLFRSPTIEEFAQLLTGDAQINMGDYHETVVPIQTDGTKEPFFCIGGGVINLNNVARLLGADQPFYALQWQGLSNQQLLHGELPDIAQTFIEAIKTVQPSGPYYLGASFTAGMVVVEMARQLEANDEKVALLVGFDTVITKGSSATTDKNLGSHKKKRSVFQKVTDVIARGPADIWENYITNPVYLEKIQLRFFRAAINVHRAINRPLPLWLRTGMAEEQLILQVTKNYYPPEKYDGDFDIFLTPRHYEKYGILEKSGWSAWIEGEVRVHQTPGEPCTIMLDPNVEKLALDFSNLLQHTYIKVEPQQS